MTFADLVAGDAVFVDANTLLYHCTIDPVFGSACTISSIGLAAAKFSRSVRHMSFWKSAIA